MQFDRGTQILGVIHGRDARATTEKAGGGGSIPSLATSMTAKSKGQGAKVKKDTSLCSLPLALCALPWPVIPDSILEEMKGDVLGMSAGVAKFFDHTDRAVGIEAVHHNCRRPL